MFCVEYTCDTLGYFVLCTSVQYTSCMAHYSRQDSVVPYDALPFYIHRTWTQLTTGYSILRIFTTCLESGHTSSTAEMFYSREFISYTKLQQ